MVTAAAAVAAEPVAHRRVCLEGAAAMVTAAAAAAAAAAEPVAHRRVCLERAAAMVTAAAAVAASLAVAATVTTAVATEAAARGRQCCGMFPGTRSIAPTKSTKKCLKTRMQNLLSILLCKDNSCKEVLGDHHNLPFHRHSNSCLKDPRQDLLRSSLRALFCIPV